MNPGAVSGLSRAVLIASVASLATFACRMPLRYDVKPGTAPRCADGVCLEIVSFVSHRSEVGAWIQAPPGTRLLNAHLLADETPPCRADTMPLEWVTLDDQTIPAGPADVSGAHGLVLGFPINAWFGHSGYWKAMFVDVELDVGGRARCLRTRLTDANGDEAVGR